MAYSQAQVDALEAALAQGVTTVQYNDRTVTYRSVQEMLRILELMKRSITKPDPANARVFMSHSKGL